MNKIRSILLVLVLFPAWSPCHAGWVLGSDSDTEGILKVSRNTGVVRVWHCTDGKNEEECVEIVEHHGIVAEKVTDYAQLGGLVLLRGFSGYMALFAGAEAWIWRGVWSRRIIASHILAAGGLAVIAAVPLHDRLDIERMNNYRKIYSDDFLKHDMVIVLPDTIGEIAENLGYTGQAE